MNKNSNRWPDSEPRPILIDLDMAGSSACLTFELCITVVSQVLGSDLVLLSHLRHNLLVLQRKGLDPLVPAGMKGGGQGILWSLQG